MPQGGVVPGNHGLFKEPRVVPARELAGASNVLFRRNSQSGAVEALARGGQGHRAGLAPARRPVGLSSYSPAAALLVPAVFRLSRGRRPARVRTPPKDKVHSPHQHHSRSLS